MHPALTIRGLRRPVHPGLTIDVPALDIPAGPVTALIGASGSGKSTLLRILGRLDGDGYRDAGLATGQVLLHARRLEAAAPLDLLATPEETLLRLRVRGPIVGFVHQQEALFSGLSVCDNVAWPLTQLGIAPAEAERRAEAWLERVGLAAGRAVHTLSGGERKRLALARALAPEPELLLLDEPFTGLDPQAQGELVALVKAQGARGDPPCTIVLVTHEPRPFAALAERVVLLAHGAVQAEGPCAALQSEIQAFFAGAGPAAGSTNDGAQRAL